MNKVSRNDPCPCGSGKKYKKCCGIKEVESRKPRLGGAKMVPPSAAAKNPSVNLARKVFKVLTGPASSQKETPKTAEETLPEEPPKSYNTLEELIGVEGAPKEVMPPSQ